MTNKCVLNHSKKTHILTSPSLTSPSLTSPVLSNSPLLTIPSLTGPFLVLDDISLVDRYYCDTVEWPTRSSWPVDVRPLAVARRRRQPVTIATWPDTTSRRHQRGPGYCRSVARPWNRRRLDARWTHWRQSTCTVRRFRRSWRWRSQTAARWRERPTPRCMRWRGWARVRREHAGGTLRRQRWTESGQAACSAMMCRSWMASPWCQWCATHVWAWSDLSCSLVK